ncbi:MAG: hypothetical protein WEA77_05845, partial [Hyphomonas sp.]|uniref:hypothetical protein n=1 Tax=Hyphomonas sp. TaxID=87 RepID=UPI0034A05FD5
MDIKILTNAEGMQACLAGSAFAAKRDNVSPKALRALVSGAALSLFHLAAFAQSVDITLPQETLRAISAEMPDVMAPQAQGNKRAGDEAALGISTLTIKGETRISPLAWSPDVIPWRGQKVETVNVAEGGHLVTRYWSELEPAARRNLLSNSYTTTQIIEIRSDGSLSIIPVTGSLKRKSYTLVYNNFRYMDAPCSASDPGAGRLLVGVGLRVEATIKAKENGIGIGLPKLALSA